MTKAQRVISMALSVGLLLSGFAIGRWTSPTTVNAEDRAATTDQQTVHKAANNDSAVYAGDYKTGFSEGFKEGYANGYQANVSPQPIELSAFANPSAEEVAPIRTRTVSRTVSRPVYYERRARNSKLKTALTIAAPAAVGAGIGALAGGKKGAGVGALIGGGGGALYHLFKNR